MRTRRPRSLIRQDGRDLAFCHIKFRTALRRHVDKRRDEGVRITQTELCQKLADHLNLSQDSIDNYRKGYNGPASIEVVKDIADYLEVEWTELMKEVTPMAEKKMTVNKSIEKNITNEASRQETPASPVEQTTPEVAFSPAGQTAPEVAFSPAGQTTPEVAFSPAGQTTPEVAFSPAGQTTPEVNFSNNAAPLTEFEKASAWLAVRDVYKAMCVFVSFFEGDHSVVLDLEDSGSDPIIRCYDYCWKVLHRNLLDIPDQTYEQLYELIKELGYWVYGLPEEPVDDDFVTVDKGIRMDYFANLFALELSDEMEVEESEWAEKVTAWLVDDYYDAIRQILKNFIPREPAAGMGCPQKNPNVAEK